MDSLTLLSSRLPAAKDVTLDAEGQLHVSSPGLSRLFDVEVAAVDGLSSLYEQVRTLQSAPGKMVIRGQLVDGRPMSNVRRISRPSGDDPANFRAVPRRWIMVDIDQLPLPEIWADVDGNVEDIVRHAVGQLPEAFHDTACVYQWSGSMGFKMDQIRVHLWFWLDRPVSDKEACGWLAGFPVDRAVYNPVQPHFTANPVVGDGIPDPISQRVGLYRPPGAADTVRVPAELKDISSTALNRRHVSAAGVIDPQDVVRNPISGLVVDGRERFLLLKSNEATRELVRGRGKKAPLPEVGEIADLTWSLFQAETDLADGKWTFSDAEAEAKRRLDELACDKFRFRGRSDNTTLQPAQEPFAELDLVDAATGQRRLETALTSFFDQVPEGPRMALRIAMGAGKTRSTLKHLKAYLAASYGKRVEVYVPRHDLAEQYARDIATIGGFAAEVIHVKPRTGGYTGVLPTLCRRPEFVRMLEQAKIGVFQNACRANDGTTCSHFAKCEYISQFDEVPHTSSNQGNSVRILVHQYLGLPRNPIQTDPDLVIIDEAFLNEVIDTATAVPSLEIRRHVQTLEFPALGRIIADCLETRRPLLKALRDHGVSARHLEEVNLDGLLPEVAFDPNGEQPVVTEGNAGLYRSLKTMLGLLQEELKGEARRDECERTVFDTRQGVVRLAFLKDLGLPETCAVLCLDATADQMLLEAVIGPCKVIRIDVEQKAIVTQVHDRTGSKGSWNSDTAPVAELVDIVNAWADCGERPLVVGHKSLADKLREWPGIHHEVRINHFSALRGSNDAEDSSVIFITGRNMPPPAEVDLKARALFWADEESLSHDEAASTHGDIVRGERLATQFRGYIQSARNQHPQSGVAVPGFSDARVDALHAQIRDAETMQALGRLRLVHASHRKQVFLLSNLPVEIPVDRFAAFDALMPDRLELELIRKGNIPLSPVGMMRMRPDLTADGEVAKKLLQRSRVRDPSRLQSMPEFVRNGMFVVEFTAENSGRKSRHQHLFMLSVQPSERLTEAEAVRVAASRIPLGKWVDYLRHGDPEIEGSGWGGVHDAQLRYAYGDNKL